MPTLTTPPPTGTRGPARRRRRSPRPHSIILDAQRRDAFLGSEAAFLISFAIVFVLSGVGAYFYGQWTLSM